MSSEEENYGIQAPPSTPDDRKLTKFIELNENASDLDRSPEISIEEELKDKNSDPTNQSNQSKTEDKIFNKHLILDEKDEVLANENLIMRRSGKALRFNTNFYVFRISRL